MLSAPRYHPYILFGAVGFALARVLRDPADPIVASRLSLRRRRGNGRALLAFRLCFPEDCPERFVQRLCGRPRGDVAPIGPYTGQRGLPELLAGIAATPPRDAYFFYPYDAMLPFLTGREHLSKYDIFAPGYTSPVQYQEACRSVMRGASWVVVDRTWTDAFECVEGQSFPSMPDPEPQETMRFQQALDSAFELVPITGTFELRRRREGVSKSVCDGIAQE